MEKQETVALGFFETITEVRFKSLSEAEMRSLECDQKEADNPDVSNLVHHSTIL